MNDTRTEYQQWQDAVVEQDNLEIPISYRIREVVTSTLVDPPKIMPYDLSDIMITSTLLGVKK